MSEPTSDLPPAASQAEITTMVATILTTMNRLVPSSSAVDAHVRHRLGDIALELLPRVTDFESFPWPQFARCRDLRLADHLPDGCAKGWRMNDDDLDRLLAAGALTQLRALKRIGFSFSDKHVYLIARGADRSASTGLLDFLDEVGRAWDHAEMLRAFNAPHYSKLAPRTFSVLLRAQVAAFPESSLGLMKTFSLNNAVERILMFWLAGLDVRPEHCDLAGFAAGRVLPLLGSAHGKMRLRSETGDLEAFLENPVARLNSLSVMQKA